jgi:aminoglycoside phosphotransferase (APT) family kinase protein
MRRRNRVDRDGLMSDTKDYPGMNRQRLTTWMRETLPEVGPDLDVRLIAGGKSNLTYEVSDHRQSWVVRRPPLGRVLATAHDMKREFRVMTALRETAVPVPVTYALCTDTDVLGVPFYVMERVGGMPYRFAQELAPLGVERTRGISEAVVDTLIALHNVDPAAVGLGDFGRPQGFLVRQVRRWKAQMDASYHRNLPAADDLYDTLVAAEPPESTPGIVHGDYRLDNLLVGSDDRVLAVLDWEMATLGDPATDLALMVVYDRLGRSLKNGPVTDAASAPGYLTEDQLVARYAESSDRDLSEWGYYVGLASYKLAVILEGIQYRHLQGDTVGKGFEHLDAAIHPLLASGLAATKEHH